METISDLSLLDKESYTNFFYYKNPILSVSSY